MNFAEEFAKYQYTLAQLQGQIEQPQLEAVEDTEPKGKVMNDETLEVPTRKRSRRTGVLEASAYMALNCIDALYIKGKKIEPAVLDMLKLTFKDDQRMLYYDGYVNAVRELGSIMHDIERSGHPEIPVRAVHEVLLGMLILGKTQERQIMERINNET